jgi:hypothetical protein
MRIPCLVAIAVALLLDSSPAGACTCIVERDPVKARTRLLDRADLVFRGHIVRLLKRVRPEWTCEAVRVPEIKPSPGCVLVRTYSGTCDRLSGVEVRLLTDGDRHVAKTWTKDTGEAQICGLDATQYRLLVRAPKLRQESRDITITKDAASVLSIYLSDAEVVHDVRAEFMVDSILKGPKLQTVTVETWDHEASCGYGGFVGGGEYEIFARAVKSADGPRRYTVDLCTVTKDPSSQPRTE